MVHLMRILAYAGATGGLCSALLACAPPDYTEGTEPTGSCEDGDRNGDESDIDCGGGTCPPCDLGQSCRSGTDCARGECTGGVCRSPHCANGKADRDEEGVDCGGADCPVCEQPLCENGVPNEGETDIDCGGGCEPCALGQKCETARDCASGYCSQSGVCQDAHCLNGKKDSSETDKDCGGPDCDPCEVGEGCQLPRDCVDLVCKEEECQAARCDDKVANGDETDTDCGGDCERTCPNGAGCKAASDCTSGVCTGNVCQVPTCDDGVKNGDETAKDCGGAQCQATRTCSIDQACIDHADCASGWCDPDEKACTEPTCQDGFDNGDETDVDCGGSCKACKAGFHCEAPDDCESGHCLDDVCQTPTCEDGIQNQGEGGIDCGGSSACEPCANGTACTADDDCESGVCADSICAGPTCDDGTQNGVETDIDCGGDNECPRCGALQKCQAPSDCDEGFECPAETGICVKPQCANGEQDEDETDQDCGGTCPPCADAMACAVNKDCQSQVCDEETLTCTPPSCDDGIKNGDEPYEDCGGSNPDCPRCEVGIPCTVGTDCVSGSCGREEGKQATTCLEPTCEDGIRNGDEVGTDCMGPCPNKCPANEPCTDNDDCESGVCTDRVCQAPKCNDKTKNGSETDVDCGGNCDRCGDELNCQFASDCESQVCQGSVCQAPSCEDGIKNGGETGKDCGGSCLPIVCPLGEGCSSEDDCDAIYLCRNDICVHFPCENGVQEGYETDIDCGGSDCPPCAVGDSCGVGSDCQSLSCSANHLCLAPTCDDEIINQGETDADCGGSTDCDRCADGKVCVVDDDCASLVCRDTGAGPQCQAPTCSDQTKNQGEGDIDCGGPCPSRCAAGDACGDADDCRSGLCTANECQQGELEVYFYGTASGQDYWINAQAKNVTSASINLSSYTLRYYFSHEGSSGAPAAYDTNNTCTVSFTQDSGSAWHANITPSSQTVAAGATSSTIKFRLHNNAPSNTIIWTNDYSYGSQSTFSTEPWRTLPAYKGSTLVFGIPGP